MDESIKKMIEELAQACHEKDVTLVLQANEFIGNQAATVVLGEQNAIALATVILNEQILEHVGTKKLKKIATSYKLAKSLKEKGFEAVIDEILDSMD